MALSTTMLFVLTLENRESDALGTVLKKVAARKLASRVSGGRSESILFYYLEGKLKG